MITGDKCCKGVSHAKVMSADFMRCSAVNYGQMTFASMISVTLVDAEKRPFAKWPF